MTPVSDQFRRAWRDAGSLAAELPWWGWVDDWTLLTLRGELLVFAELAVLPVAGRPRAHLGGDVATWQRVLGQCPPECRLSLHALCRPCEVAQGPVAADFPEYAWLVRGREVAGRSHEVRVIAGWCLDPGLAAGSGAGRQGSHGLRALFGRERRETVYREEAIEAGAARLRQIAESQVALLGGPGSVTPLGADASTAVLSELVNRPGVPPPRSVRDGGIAWRVALSDIETHARYMLVDGLAAAVYSLAEPPPECRPDMLSDLFQVGGAWTWHWEWRRLDTAGARAKITSARRHYFQKRFSMVAHMQEKEGTTLAMEDSAATTEAERMAQALIDVESDGVPYGELACGITLYGGVDEVDGRAGDLVGFFASVDIKAIRETYGQLPQYLARLPGQPAARQLRPMLLSAPAAACLAPLWGDRPGHDRCRHLEADALAVFETPSRRRYHFDLFHGGDVGHTLILGATGAGKSFLLNFLLTNSLRYAPRVCVLDLGGGYRSLTTLAGGDYLTLDPDAPRGALALQPFRLEGGERTLSFLAGWIQRLLAIGGYQASGNDVTELRDRLDDAYRLPVDRRGGLGTFAQTLPARMRGAMSRWVGKGAWGHIFDSEGREEVRVGHTDWQVVDISGAAQHPDLAEAALGYFLERMRIQIEDPDELARLKIMVVDEAWKFLGDDATAGYLAESAKTWRKKNAVLVLASQSAGDVIHAAGAAQILESLPHRIYLANPDLPDSAAEALQLSATEVALIRRLQPKCELYLKSRGGNSLLRLLVGRGEYWLYTSTPTEVAKREQALERAGNLPAALRELAGGPA